MLPRQRHQKCLLALLTIQYQNWGIPVLDARSVQWFSLWLSKIYKYSASAQNHRCSTSPGSILRYRNLYFRREALARLLVNRYSRLSERGTRLNKTGDKRYWIGVDIPDTQLKGYLGR